MANFFLSDLFGVFATSFKIGRATLYTYTLPPAVRTLTLPDTAGIIKVVDPAEEAGLRLYAAEVFR